MLIHINNIGRGSFESFLRRDYSQLNTIPKLSKGRIVYKYYVYGQLVGTFCETKAFYRPKLTLFHKLKQSDYGKQAKMVY
jgi:hypothetical protein